MNRLNEAWAMYLKRIGLDKRNPDRRECFNVAYFACFDDILGLIRDHYHGDKSIIEWLESKRHLMNSAEPIDG